MVNAKSGIGVVGVVAVANVATAWAQSAELPRRPRERISRTLVDEGSPSAAAGFYTEVKITASDGAAGGNFGFSVAISGATAIVGAHGDSDNGADSGSAYVYGRDEGGVDNWGEVTKLTASDGAAGDTFGHSVAISGDRAIVGGRFGKDNGNASGSAYVYQQDNGGADNWGQVAKITASDGAADDLFGLGVAISGVTAIAGASHYVDNGESSGSAYVYSPTACSAQADCNDSDPCSFDRCIDNLCSFDVNARHGDVAGEAGVCGPNGNVDLFDILALLDGFEGRYAEGCELANVDIAGAQGGCEPDDSIDLADILAVLDAFQGLDNCCGNGR